VGSTGNSYDNALAESIIGLYKTEVIRHSGPWRSIEHVEFETLKDGLAQQPAATRADWGHSSR